MYLIKAKMIKKGQKQLYKNATREPFIKNVKEMSVKFNLIRNQKNNYLMFINKIQLNKTRTKC